MGEKKKESEMQRKSIDQQYEQPEKKNREAVQKRRADEREGGERKRETTMSHWKWETNTKSQGKNNSSYNAITKRSTHPLDN